MKSSGGSTLRTEFTTPCRLFLPCLTAGVLAGILPAASRAAEQSEMSRPNILWLDAEDANVHWFGCYGNPGATTPNIDRLAAEGFRYTHAFASAPVCSPSRSTWITGIHGRTGSDEQGQV